MFFSGSLVTQVLVPLDVAGIGTSLVPLQGIHELVGAGTEGEVEGAVGLQHDVARHLEAVEVAR